MWCAVDKYDMFAWDKTNGPWSNVYFQDYLELLFARDMYVTGKNMRRFFYYHNLTKKYMSHANALLEPMEWADSPCMLLDMCRREKCNLLVMGGLKIFKTFAPLVDDIYMIKTNTTSRGRVHFAQVIPIEICEQFVFDKCYEQSRGDEDATLNIWHRRKSLKESQTCLNYTLSDAIAHSYQECDYNATLKRVCFCDIKEISLF